MNITIIMRNRGGGGRMTKTNFIRYLKTLNLTRQQKRTLRGQALSGDLEGARKGLAKLLEVKP